MSLRTLIVVCIVLILVFAVLLWFILRGVAQPGMLAL